MASTINIDKSGDYYLSELNEYDENSEIVIGSNLSVNLFEDYSSDSAKKNMTYVTKSYSNLNIFQIYENANSRYSFLGQLEKNANISLYQWVIANDSNTEIVFHCESNKLNAKFSSYSTLLASNNAKIDQTVRTNLHSRQSYNYHRVRAVCDDSAHVDSKSIVNIDSFVSEIDSDQCLKAILLSDKARINLKPVLEINSFDVKCKHGASVGPIDQNHVVYMMQRGLNYDDAFRLILSGFVLDQFEVIPNINNLKKYYDKVSSFIMRDSK